MDFEELFLQAKAGEESAVLLYSFAKYLTMRPVDRVVKTDTKRHSKQNYLYFSICNVGSQWTMKIM